MYKPVQKVSTTVLIIMAIITLIAAPTIAAPLVILNGQQLSFDVPPVVENGSTLVPLRAIFVPLGATVDWNDNTQTVTAIKAGIEIKLTLGQAVAYKNGSPVSLSVPAKSIDNRTMVPLRFVSEALGASVIWDNNTQTVFIMSPPTTSNNSNTAIITINYNDGSKYTGEVQNLIPNGQGVLFKANGDKYEGQFVDGKFNGTGTYTWFDGQKYVGQWLTDERTGQGTYTWTNGDKYVGEFIDGLLNGQGTYTGNDGSIYTGSYSQGKRSGYGKIVYSNGSGFAGIWKDDKATPQGTYSNNSDESIPAYIWDYKGQLWKWDPSYQISSINIFLGIYSKLPHPHRTRMDYLRTYCINTTPNEKQMLNDVATCLKNGAVNAGYDEWDTVSYVSAFVQSFTYVSDLASTGYDEYIRYPLETLFSRKGDCEDTAILTATLIRELGYGTALILFDNHCAVGIKGDNTISGTYYEVKGIRYYYLETTAKGWSIGQIPEERKSQKAIVLPLP